MLAALLGLTSLHVAAAKSHTPKHAHAARHQKKFKTKKYKPGKYKAPKQKAKWKTKNSRYV